MRHRKRGRRERGGERERIGFRVERVSVNVIVRRGNCEVCVEKMSVLCTTSMLNSCTIFIIISTLFIIRIICIQTVQVTNLDDT